MRPSSRHAAPAILQEGGGVRALQRVVLGQSGPHGLGEEALQRLVHDHPELLPMAEIEPAFTPLLSVCRELPTGAGSLDNLWVTPDGALVLGECKLVKNPQARREVVAQALDYARALAGMTLEQLEDALRRTGKRAADRLWQVVAEDSALDEAQFNDAVARRLKRGSFLILIIGDGIQEGVEELSDYLQMHAGLRTSLALVDLSFWRDGERLLVVPRVPAKTVLVERGVVRIEDGAIRVDPPREADLGQRFTLTEEAFFEDLRRIDKDLPSRLDAFLRLVEPFGIEPEFQKSLVLRYHASPDHALSIGYLGRNGKAYNIDAAYNAIKLGVPDVGEAYAGALAGLIGGQIRRRQDGLPYVHGPDGRALRLQDLLKDPQGWAEAVRRWTEAIQAAVDGPA